MDKPIPLPEHQLREVAVAASCDPRTVRKLLLGEKVSPLVRARIERVLRARGLAPLLTTSPERGQ